MGSPYRTTYEYVINSWVPVADGQQQLQQPQPCAPPAPQPCVMMQPCYVPSQQPVCQPPKQQTCNNNRVPAYSAAYSASTYLPEPPSNFQQPCYPCPTGGGRPPAYPASASPSYPPAQSSAFLGGPPPPSRSSAYPPYPASSGQSQMYVMTPIESYSSTGSARNATCNAKRSSSSTFRIIKRTKPKEYQVRTRTVSCTATLPRKKKCCKPCCPPCKKSCCTPCKPPCKPPCRCPPETSWICVDGANSDSNSDGGSTEDDPCTPRRTTQVHVNIRKTPRCPKKKTSSFICKTCPDDDDGSSSDATSGDDDDGWRNSCSNNKSNNNITDVPEAPDCDDDDDDDDDDDEDDGGAWARLENSNNSNNRRQYRPHSRNSDMYLEEEARRIGGKLAMDALPETSSPSEMTMNTGTDWDTGERGGERGGERRGERMSERGGRGNAQPQRRLIIPHADDRGSFNPVEWLSRYRGGNSEEAEYAMNDGPGLDGGNGDYGVSAGSNRPQAQPQPVYASKSSVRPRRMSSRDVEKYYTDQEKLLRNGIAIQISVFVTAVCYSLHLGCLSRLENDLLKDTATYQQIEHSVSVIQFLASYLFGRYCDISGLYTAFFVTYLTSALSYSLMSLAQDDYLIFASQTIRVFVHNVEIGQIAICQMAPAENRVVMLGKVALANGLGMKFGGIFAEPLIQQFGVHDLSLILSGVQCAGLLVLLLTNLHGQLDRPKYQERTLEKMFSANWIHELLSSPRLLNLLVAQFFTSLAVYVFQGAFPQMAVSYFHMSKDQLGMCLTYIALVTLITQAIGVNLVVAAIKEDTLALTLSMGLTIIYFVMMLVPNMLHIWLLMFPLSVSVTLLNLILTSSLSTCGPRHSIGSTLGLNMMVVLLSKAMAPVLISAVTSDSNFVDVALLGLACSGVTCLLLYHENNTKRQ